MGYFPNGTAGDAYEAEHCARCVHGDNYRSDDKGCPIMLAHVLYSYELCNQEKHPGKVMLDMFIPREGAGNSRCVMFVDAASVGITKPEYVGPPIPDTPHGWMLRLCRHGSEYLSKPFRVDFKGTAWTAATDGLGALMIRGATEWPRVEQTPPVTALFANPPKKIAETELANIKAWCRAPIAVLRDNGKPGRFFGRRVDRLVLGKFVESLADGVVAVRAKSGELDPVILESADWRLCVMPMRPGPCLDQEYPFPAPAKGGG